ncbi:MAG: DUF169 domain-containing protein [Methanothrix sp.]|uniref:DUF169 domain-containing protein n=1 Tax=Methanothrix thermoacetophila (strain DSM 6194 / JCM 14653 / NBRC 101360 / PT) TaxID=349307 RepID=A0B6S2_METTP|nr:MULTISPECIES: DUF169 domain-containing protein [Methanothrix]ABK14396.1 protein of unknown function DUF169 [Methanothrix thermoacetophila PT]MBC7079609.1 DUF169 domain-containing protein [Methanothrix sp.]NPU87578.1 DUF169 domain-containing protein [Methanothrix sp.]
MDYAEMSDILKSTLGLDSEPVGVVLFKSEEDIPKDLKEIESPLPYCGMVQRARRGEVLFARSDKHACRGGAAGIGLHAFPDNIVQGKLYFSKLNKCATPTVGQRIVSNLPKIPAGSTVATLVAPLSKLNMNPDVVIFVGNALQARRIVQAVLYRRGGRMNLDTAGIQSFCVDATASPILKGDVNVSLGCDGSAKKTGLTDNDVVVGIPFEMLEDICRVLKERHEGWDRFMRS